MTRLRLLKILLSGFLVPLCSLFSMAQERCPSIEHLFEKPDRMVGSFTALAPIEAWPAFIALRHTSVDGVYSNYSCGATLIHPEWVLTAAHCVSSHTHLDSHWFDRRGWKLELVSGASDLLMETELSLHKITNVTIHPDYAFDVNANGDPTSQYHDVALIRIEPSDFSSVLPISINEESDPSEGARLFSAGHGLTGVDGNVEDGGWSDLSDSHASPRFVFAGSTNLLHASIPLQTSAACSTQYAEHNPEMHLCAGYQSVAEDSCSGDSGGPLVALDVNACPYLVGVVSYGGEQCGNGRQAGVYARVANYADWISEVMAEYGASLPGDAPIPETSAKNVNRVADGLLAQFHSDTPFAAPIIHSIRGTSKPEHRYRQKENDIITIGISPPVSGVPIIIDVRASGELAQVFPTKCEQLQPIAAHRPIPLGRFAAVAPLGEGRLISMVVPTNLARRLFSDADGRCSFPNSDMQLTGNYAMNTLRVLRSYFAENEMLVQSDESLGAFSTIPRESESWKRFAIGAQPYFISER